MRPLGSTGLLFLLGLSSGLSAQDRSAVELVFYGDSRAGLLQSRSDPSHTPGQIHNAITARIGSLEGLADHKAVLFLGDAVSHGGCPNLWKDHFFPAVKRLVAFTDSSGGLLFYPVIGDHETFLIPESYEEAQRPSVRCPIFEAIYQAPLTGSGAASMPARRSGLTKEEYRKVASLQRLPAQIRCPSTAPAECDNPGISGIQLSHCRMCEYQRKDCSGNCGAYAFRTQYTSDNGFAPFRAAWERMPSGASWYKVDFRIGSDEGQQRLLRVLFLDTQADADLRSSDGMTQPTWLRAQVAAMSQGDFVILAGHQTPGNRSDLYGPPIEAAFDRGVRVLAVLAGHYHGFGSGSLNVRDTGPPRGGSVSVQEVYFAISGDGGSRDGGSKLGVLQKDMIAGGRIGGRLRIESVAGKEWKTDADPDIASFARIRITSNDVTVTDYRVRLDDLGPTPGVPSMPQEGAGSGAPVGSLLTEKRRLQIALSPEKVP